MNVDQEIGQRNRTELGLNLNYPFSLGLSPFYDVKAKETGTEVQSLLLQGLKNTLSLKLGLLYFLWELAEEKVAVQQVFVDDLREYHLHMRNLQQGGMQSQAKVLEAKARLEKANVELLIAQSAVDSLLLELSDFIQLNDSAAQPKTYDLRRLSKTGSPQSVYRNYERAELVALDRQAEQLDLYKRAMLGRRMPGLNFQFGLRYGNPGLNMASDEYMSWATLGLQLRWLFYDGRENWAQRTMLQQDKEMLKLERQKQEEQWNKMADQALLQITKARRMQEASRIALEAAQASAEDLHNAVQAGVAATVEYLEALKVVAETRYTLASAQAMEKMAFLQLQYSRGEEIQF
jgi:outer membrane protein TolC